MCYSEFINNFIALTRKDQIFKALRLIALQLMCNFIIYLLWVT